MKEAEEKVGLSNLMDEHEAKKFNENLDKYGKYVKFTVTNVNKQGAKQSKKDEDSTRRLLDGHAKDEDAKDEDSKDDNKGDKPVEDLKFMNEVSYSLKDLTLPSGP
jgi:hypothetical protein